jgi:UDP-hydrolysing UDP-N-acetyl-D-glucosamine 2-epimerase
MGEEEAYVFNTGCPSIDIAHQIKQNPTLDFDPIKKYGGVGKDIDWRNGYLVVMQHPVTTEYEQAKEHITSTLKVIDQLNVPTFWFWPNVDAGADGTSNGIRSYRELYQPENIHFFKNMIPEDFLKLLVNSKGLIGNSSVGIRECAFLGVPVVNIGTRQHGRQRGKNVIDVSYQPEEIKKAIEQKLLNSINDVSDKIYGKGDSGEQIAEVLATVALRFHKTITY